MPLAAVAAIGAIGSVAGGAIASSGAKSAANTQAQAAMQAAELQHQDAQAALGFQQNVFGTQQQELAPWLSAGQGGLANLQYLMGLPVNGNAYTPGPMGPVNAAAASGGPNNLPSNNYFQPGANLMGVPLTSNVVNKSPGNFSYTSTPGSGATGQSAPMSSLINPNLGAAGSLMQPFGEQFQAPTNVTEQNDPGYQFRLQQGMKALENSAAARGDILSGGTAKAATRYGQDYASNEYQNVYNRQFNEYATRYNQYQTQQANQFNRLGAVAGIGQTAANQLGYLGQNAAGNIGNILMTSGNQIGQNINNAGAARASGYVGSANAWGSALNNLGGLAMMYGLQNQANAQNYLNNMPSAPYTDPSIIANAIPQGICWVAQAIYGENDPRWLIARARLLDWESRSRVGAFFVGLYRKYGERAAKIPAVVRILKPLFDKLVA